MLDETLIFKHGTVTYKIVLRSKITVLRGDSGSGKTTLISNLGIVDHKTRPSNVYVVNVMSTPLSVHEQLISDYDIVFIDEDNMDRCREGGWLRRLCKRCIQLVLAYRDPMPELQYGYTDVKVLKTDGVSDSEFDTSAVDAYDRFDKLPISDSYICEDSKSGFIYFSHWLQNVSHMDGIKNCLRRAGDGTLILDGAAVGNYMDELVKCKASLFLPVSFEYLVAKKFATENPMQYWTPEFLTFERFFTWYCCQSGKLPFRYSKGNIPSVVLNSRLIPELDRKSPVVLTRENDKHYFNGCMEKQHLKSSVAELLSDLGEQDKFDKVFSALPEILEDSTFVTVVTSILGV